MMFQCRLSCVGGIGSHHSFGASTILGSRIAKVEPRPGSLLIASPSPVPQNNVPRGGVIRVFAVKK